MVRRWLGVWMLVMVGSFAVALACDDADAPDAIPAARDVDVSDSDADTTEPMPEPPPAPGPPRRPQWFERTDPAFVSLAAALPTSRLSSIRESTAKVLVEVRPHPARSDSASVVIAGHVVDDIRSVSGRRLLTRWFNALHFVHDLGWEPPPNGFVVAAAVEVDTDVVLEILTLAFGRNLDGPVELALRRGGARDLTTVPVAFALELEGVQPIAGPWGVAARAIDDARLGQTASEPLVLELGDIAEEVMRFRWELERPTTVTRIVAARGLPGEAVRRVAEKHRSHAAECHRHAVFREPDLDGRWDATFEIDRRGRARNVDVVHAMVERNVEVCLERVIARWRFAPPRKAVAATLAFDFSLVD